MTTGPRNVGLQACRLWAAVPPAKAHESLAAAFAYFQRLTRDFRPCECGAVADT